jgi:geranylgeranyl pyrophosphate synthase
MMMPNNTGVQDLCYKILEDNGGQIADRARAILLEDSRLKTLRSPLAFISKNWRDILTPALMSLSCQAVGGRANETNEAALAFSLMNLGFYVWDDLVDRARFKSFKPTLSEAFGEETALIIGGIASAKAFLILNEVDIDKEKRQKISRLFWNLWTKMAQAETTYHNSCSYRSYSSRKKLGKILMEASADPETCLKIGVVIGNGSKNDARHLGIFGQHLGAILELHKDFLVSINFTLELAEKIRNGTLPYSLLWASEHSEKIQKQLTLLNRASVQPSDIKEIVENIFEAKTYDHIINIIRQYAEKADNELIEIKKNRAVDALRFFAKAQAELLTSKLSAHNPHRS